MVKQIHDHDKQLLLSTTFPMPQQCRMLTRLAGAAGAGATWAELNELLGPHSTPAKASTYNYSMTVDTDKD